MFGVELVPIELASMPLMRTLLLVVRWPLTLMTESPRPSSVLFETLAEERTRELIERLRAEFAAEEVFDEEGS